MRSGGGGGGEGEGENGTGGESSGFWLSWDGTVTGGERREEVVEEVEVDEMVEASEERRSCA